MRQATIDLTAIRNMVNPCYIPLMTDASRYIVLKGGASSGKSKFTAQKLIRRVISETPPKGKKHRILVLRKVAATLRGSVFEELKTVIYEWGVEPLFNIPKGNSGDLYIQHKFNGNEFIFAGLDDVEKLKSIKGITSIWIEEATELLLTDFNQIDLRMRDKLDWTYKQIIISFNPISATHWLKRTFFDNDISEYFKSLAEQMGETIDISNLKATVSQTTYKDNIFLSVEQKFILESYKHTDPYYYQVYCLGQWGVIGDTVFPAEIVSARIAELMAAKRELKRGYFTYDKDNAERIIKSSIKWVDAANGEITIYKEPDELIPYVLGGDTAGDGSDYFTAHIIDNTTGEQTAVYHKQKVDEDLYSEQVFCLGIFYNNALCAVETNFSTHPLKVLERLRYPRLYVRQQTPDAFTGKLSEKHGFQTTKTTRPQIIAGLIEVVRDNPELINDIKTLEEMLTFVRNEKGRPEAQDGAHDDLIMGLAITYGVRGQQSMSKYKCSQKALQGAYLPSELDDLLKAGLITRKQKLDYMKGEGKKWAG